MSEPKSKFKIGDRVRVKDPVSNRLTSGKITDFHSGYFGDRIYTVHLDTDLVIKYDEIELIKYDSVDDESIGEEMSKFSLGNQVKVIGPLSKSYPEVGTIVDIIGVGFVPEYKVFFDHYTGSVRLIEDHLELVSTRFKVGDMVQVSASINDYGNKIGEVSDITGSLITVRFGRGYLVYFTENELSLYQDKVKCINPDHTTIREPRVGEAVRFYTPLDQPQEVFTKTELEYIRRLVDAELDKTEELRKKLERLENAANS